LEKKQNTIQQENEAMTYILKKEISNRNRYRRLALFSAGNSVSWSKRLQSFLNSDVVAYKCKNEDSGRLEYNTALAGK
jgi:hypothetical protein